MYWNFSGQLLSTLTNLNFNSQFKNRWRINGNFTRIAENTSTSLLRGGPSFIVPGGEEMNLNLSTDHSKKFTFNVGNYQGFGDLNSYRNKAYWVGVNMRPMNALSISFSPEYINIESELQYVETIQQNNDTRYLFGRLNQETMSFTFRLNYTFTPELSLEYYGQPFVSAGKYTGFKRTTNTTANNFSDRYHTFSADEISYNTKDNAYAIDDNSDDNQDYTFSNPDFNFRQFRSNFVVRWEYSPGSTLFLVWSQGRTSTASSGKFDYGNDMRELFGIEPHNVFLIKFSYWFAL
jgi:hypothetical protein